MPSVLRLRSLITVVIGVFLPWYFLVMPKRIVLGYIAYAKAIGAIISPRFLLGTLFSPWKSITDAYPDNLFMISQVFGVFILNTISRAMGCIIRLATLIFGIAVQIAVLGCSAAFLAVWIGFPVLFPLGISLLLRLL